MGNLIITIIESKRCANSTDAGGREANHYIKDGGCDICGHSTRYLAWFYGLD